jgi:hypothetical protein
MGYLSSDEIVRRINLALSLTTINIATSPSDQAQYLSEFAMTASDLIVQRDPAIDDNG